MVKTEGKDAAAEAEIGLTPGEIASFEERGFVLLRGGFPPGLAAAGREVLWAKLRGEAGIDRRDPGTWVERRGLAECFASGHPWGAVCTPRILRAVDQLCGAGRWKPFGLGWWVINFPVESPDQRWGAAGRWHVDGAHYHHHINSAESGLLPIFCFSSVRPHCGGTALCVGSHKHVADLLLEHEPQGLRGGELSRMAFLRMRAVGMEVEEVRGRAGDVLFAHPFLLHARSKNLGREGADSVRFMCNPNVALHRPMAFPRGRKKCLRHCLQHYETYSPVEQAIADAVMQSTSLQKDRQTTDTSSKAALDESKTKTDDVESCGERISNKGANEAQKPFGKEKLVTADDRKDQTMPSSENESVITASEGRYRGMAGISANGISDISSKERTNSRKRKRSKKKGADESTHMVNQMISTKGVHAEQRKQEENRRRLPRVNESRHVSPESKMRPCNHGGKQSQSAEWWNGAKTEPKGQIAETPTGSRTSPRTGKPGKATPATHTAKQKWSTERQNEALQDAKCSQKEMEEKIESGNKLIQKDGGEKIEPRDITSKPRSITREDVPNTVTPQKRLHIRW